MLELFGFMCGVVILGILSFYVVVIAVLGGEEFSPIGNSGFFWCVGFATLLGYLWYLLLQNSPFTVTLGG